MSSGATGELDATRTTAAVRVAVGSPQGRLLLGLAVVAVAFVWALPSFASYGDVWNRLGNLGPSSAVVIAAVGAANLIAPATSQRAALPGLRLSDAVSTDWATTAVANTVPGGSALAVGLTWSMYRSYRLQHAAIARSIVVTGVWDTFVKFGTPLLALGWLSTQQPVGPGLVQAAMAGALLFIVVLVLGGVLVAEPAVVTTVGGFLDRLPRFGRGWSDRLAALRDDTLTLLRDRWRPLTLWTVAGHANLYLLLLVCLRAVGVTAGEASAAAVLVAFAFGRLVTALPISPGGLGVMELGLTGALAAAASAEEASVVAAVLLFRFLTFALPIPLGALAWLRWQGRRRV